MTKLKNVWNVILKSYHTCKTHPEELHVPKIWCSVLFLNKKWNMEFWPYDKTKNVWNVILKFLTRVRNHPEELLVLQNFITVLFLMSKVLYCLQRKNRKMIFWGRGVLLDEFLHMSELSTFHSVQLLIWSYGLKTDYLH